MSGEMLQHALVTLIALLAMVVIVRRVAGFIGVRSKPAQCACPSSSKGACGGSTQPVASATPQPLIMLKPSASPSAQSSRLG